MHGPVNVKFANIA